MKPSFLYFDLGNVLMRFSNERACRQVASLARSSPAELEEFLLAEPLPGTRGLLWRFEAGELTSEEFRQAIEQRFDCRLPPREFAVALSDMFAPIEESIELAAGLAASGHRLGILSNTNPLHWDWLLSEFPVLSELFPIHATSFAARSMKPAADIYHWAAKKAGIRLQEIFFTDDRAENVAGAQAVGIDAVLFTSTAQLAAELRERGLDW